MSSLWALASPIYSVPDENAHAVKAVAQLRGEVIGHRVEGIRQLVVDLPQSYSYTPAIQCFVYTPTRPADCPVELGDSGGTNWSSTWVGSYNPIYYYLAGWPSLFLGGNSGIYAMRIVSALLSAVFLAWAVQVAVASAKARWMPMAIAFLAGPMVTYLAGGINPNGIEISSAAALWIASLRLLDRHHEKLPSPDNMDPFSLSRCYLWVVASISAIILANARALGPLWVIVVVALTTIVVGFGSFVRLLRQRSSYPWLGVIAVGALFSVGWTLAGGSLSGQAEKSDAPLVGGSFVDGFLFVIKATPGYLRQALGVFGWLDTDLPSSMYWLAVAALVVVGVAAISSRSRRSTTVFLAVCLAGLLIPAFVQGYGVRSAGIIWQGRYGLFLYIGIPIVAGWILSKNESRGSAGVLPAARLTALVSVLLWMYGAAAFFFVLRRYVVGTAQPIGAMWKTPAWQPPLGWEALLALFLTISCLYFVWVLVLSDQTEKRELPAKIPQEQERTSVGNVEK